MRPLWRWESPISLKSKVLHSVARQKVIIILIFRYFDIDRDLGVSNLISTIKLIPT